MLRELAVQNLALIEDVRVELQAGFCAWTGETGAGKSLLLGALGLLLGERGSADLIRTGTDELRVTGRFELLRPELREEAERILGTPLDIHGQRESHSLLQPAYQLRLLDSFGKLDGLRQRYADVADRVRALRRQ